jgi:Na+/H+ antiporter NhaA
MAIGGMLVPAGIYVLIADSGDALRGWGIPMATQYFYTEQINLITLVIAFMVLAILFVGNTLGISNALFCATGRVLLW